MKRLQHAQCIPLVLQVPGDPARPAWLTYTDVTASLPRGRDQLGPVVGLQLTADVAMHGTVGQGVERRDSVKLAELVPVLVPFGRDDSLRLASLEPGRLLVWPMVASPQ